MAHKQSIQTTRHRPGCAVLLLASAGLAPPVLAGMLDRTECIVPAKPGGGFDLTCQLARAALAQAKVIGEPMRITYIPGGIGAVAYNAVVAQRAGDASTVVAFSGGSLLNIAQGKFGRASEHDVRWLATLGADYGAIVVADGSPFKSLHDVIAALRADPTKVVFGAGGTVGSQDWMKAALLARAAGIDPKAIRFVAFEGGGEALTALQGGHIHVFTGDVAETSQRARAGSRVRLLAVLAERRLGGDLAQVPTAREQGVGIEWPVARGFYIGPRVGDADYKLWAEAFARAMASPGFERLRREHGLQPLSLTGAQADAYVKAQVASYRRLARDFGLAAPGAAR